VSNDTDIASNSAAIVSNDTDIASNSAAIVSNDSDIATNSGAIVSNDSDIASNSAGIAGNVTGIASNSSNIAKLNGDENTDGSVANTIAGLGISADGVEGVIERKEDGIHIGTESFVFDDLDPLGHRLFTSDGSDLLLGKGGSDVVIADDLFVNGDVFINGNAGVQSQLDQNAGAIASNSNRIDSNKSDIERNARGIAMVAALQHTTVLPGMNNALDVGAAHFEGETGMSLNYARRVNENVQFNFGAAATTDFEESVIKAGIGVQW